MLIPARLVGNPRPARGRGPRLVRGSVGRACTSRVASAFSLPRTLTRARETGTALCFYTTFLCRVARVGRARDRGTARLDAATPRCAETAVSSRPPVPRMRHDEHRPGEAPRGRRAARCERLEMACRARPSRASETRVRPRRGPVSERHGSVVRSVSATAALDASPRSRSRSTRRTVSR